MPDNNFPEVIILGLLTWILVGVISGWMAGLVMKGRGFGCFGNIVIGVIGALVGGWLAGALFSIQNPITGFNPGTIVTAFLGAVIVLYIARLAKV